MKMKKLLCLLLAVVMLVGCLAACGKTETALSVVAEKESAGEEVILSDDFFKSANYTAVDTQSKALMEVSSGTADGCVVDYVCSIGMIGEGTDYANLSVVGKYAFAGLVTDENSSLTTPYSSKAYSSPKIGILTFFAA